MDASKKKGGVSTPGLRRYHRIMGTVLMLFLLYIGVTGTLTQIVDLRALLTGQPATNGDMKAIREGIDGPGNFAVIATQDYAAAPLPGDLDLRGALSKVTATARSSLGAGAPWTYVEFRNIGGQPVAQVLVERNLARFDARTGAPLGVTALEKHRQGTPALHQTLKNWHRLFYFGDLVLWLNTLIGIGLLGMVVTGTWLYFRLLRARAAQGHGALFWNAGGWWRSCHRWISVAAAAFLLVVAVTGTLLSIDSFCLGLYRAMHGTMPPGMSRDASSPLQDAQLPSMLDRTLVAFRDRHGATPVKVLRLRIYAGMPQGAIVGGSEETRQFVFNARTGDAATATEAGYPFMGFPFGWREHELVKQIHRGDILGLPGRAMDLLAGLALIFLSVSGLIMYLDLWRRRALAGRRNVFWP